MKANRYDTLSEAVNALTIDGYTEDFKAEERFIKALYSKKEYAPVELKITASFRFDEMTNPDDESMLFAIEANDGSKGTMVMSYSAKNDQNVELIKQIKNSK